MGVRSAGGFPPARPHVGGRQLRGVGTDEAVGRTPVCDPSNVAASPFLSVSSHQ